MRPARTRLLYFLMPLLLAGTVAHAKAADQILATVGALKVTATDLNSALASAPFANKFPSMDKDDQASLRGHMLRRLVAARLLTLEAQRLGIDKTTVFQRDINGFRLGLLNRAYMEKLRRSIVVPKQTLAAMKSQFRNDHEGMNAAKAAYISDRYRTTKSATLQALIKADDMRLHEDRLAGARPDTVVAEGDGLRIRYGDLLDAAEPGIPSPAELRDRLLRRAELVVVAKAALAQGIDVGAAVASYRRERLPAALVEIKTREWIPNEKTLRDWYDKHPQAATVPERRHVGQLVVATRKKADALRARIAKGESLFVLAGKYSIEPVGRKQNGDIGWVVQGHGMPELEQALARLKDGETSPVVRTGDGKFHILTVLERVGGRKERFADMRERIAQAVVDERLAAYVGELEQRYPVSWKLLAEPGVRAAAK